MYQERIYINKLSEEFYTSAKSIIIFYFSKPSRETSLVYPKKSVCTLRKAAVTLSNKNDRLAVKDSNYYTESSYSLAGSYLLLERHLKNNKDGE